MKKILAVALVLAMFAALAACEASKGDLTSIHDYIAPDYTAHIDTGYFTFEEAGGNTVVITGYVGKAEPHIVEVPSTVKVTIQDKEAATEDDTETTTEANKEENIREVVGIADNAFYYCTAMTAIKLPQTIETIGDYAFAGCIGLTEIEIPDSVTSIGEGAFYGCENLTSIDMPTKLVEIGKCAFSYCSKLKSIELPAELSSIGEAAFFECQALTEVVFPASITNIGKQAFYRCNHLSLVDMSATSTEANTVTFGQYIFWSELKDVQTTIEAPEGCVVIGVFVTPENSDAFKYIDEMENTHIGGIETEDETEGEGSETTEGTEVTTEESTTVAEDPTTEEPTTAAES